jgi:tripartite-type tricarboxylate transporter receptor subunit TctC
MNRRLKPASPELQPEGKVMRALCRKFSRRKFLHLTAGAVALPAVSRIARAQAYPSRPVRIIVPFAPAGGTDITARLIGQRLAERLGQQFIIDNRPGGASNIGTEAVVRATADGHTLLMVDASPTINATLFEKLSFNFIRDIAPVACIFRAPLVVVVHPSIPATTIPEFIAYAKANPGKVNRASGGNGSPSHVAGELFGLMTGAATTHVPYRGGGAGLPDMLSGQVHVTFAGVATTVEYIRSGQLRALAVTTDTRLEALPNVPTVSEFVPGYEASQWYGMGAPWNTPTEIIDKLNKEINAALAAPAMKGKFTNLGGSVFVGSPDDFGKLIADDTEKWAKVIRAAGIKPQ